MFVAYRCGHGKHFRAIGIAYLSRYGIPSAREDENVEYDANSRAFSYFYNKTGGNFTWDFKKHSLNDGINWNYRGDFYNNPAFQLALSSSLVSPNWYDYVANIDGYLGIIHAGYLNPVNKK